MKAAWSCLVAALLLAGGSACAQQAVTLPGVQGSNEAVAQRFSFASDGPIGPGWTRPDEIARMYFADELPALFTRTLQLDAPVPRHGKLEWIFTGPRGGVTVELTPTKVRLTQRFYDSMGLGGGGNYPSRTVTDEEQQFTVEARSLTVVLDAHLAVVVLVNGMPLLKQGCALDMLRHQLMFAAPRTEHLLVSGGLLTPPEESVSVRVNANVRHQTMLGFGGSPSIPTYERMSEQGRREYWSILQRYNLLIDREYPMGSELKPDLSNMADLGEATPHYYGDNFPNGEVSDFAYNKRAQELGGEVIYELWALPPWADQPYTGPTVIDAWNKRVRVAARPEEYARIVVGYCRRALAATGSAPAIVGLENEVEQPPEIAAAMAIVVRRELDKAGFQAVRIHMADASFMDQGIARVERLRQSPAAWTAIDYAATHEYDFQEFLANPDLYDERMERMHEASAGKAFLATEICLNDPHFQEPSYRVALNVGQLYQKNLTELDAEMLLYCWLMLDVEQPSFGASRALLVPDKTDGYKPVPSSFQLRVLGAYSRHVLRGMQRVDTVSSNPDLLSVAFAGEGHRTLVVLNRSTVPERLTVDWQGGAPWTELERTSQRSENAVSHAVPAFVDVAPGEIVTLSDLAAR